MKCLCCEFYKSGMNYNACQITGSEYFYIQEDCKFVNDDGTINEKEIENMYGESEVQND